jgi:hypothetical protein
MGAFIAPLAFPQVDSLANLQGGLGNNYLAPYTGIRLRARVTGQARRTPLDSKLAVGKLGRGGKP